MFYSGTQFHSNNKQVNYSSKQHNNPTNDFKNSQPFLNQNQRHSVANQLNNTLNCKQLQQPPNQFASQPQYNQHKLPPPEPMDLNSGYTNLKPRTNSSIIFPNN